MSRALNTFTLALSITIGLSFLSPANADAPYSTIFAFGDSLLDTGNVFLWTGGASLGPPYYQGRFSNGPVCVEVLAQQLGLPAPEASLLGGTNYAWGGAETGDGWSHFETANVGLQIESFLNDRGGFAGDELIVVTAGSNDLTWQLRFGVGQVTANFGQHIADLAAAGGKTFLVGNSPVQGAKGAKFNRQLDSELDRLEDKLDITILRWDIAGLQAEMLRRPAEFGLTNVTDSACPGCGIGTPTPEAADTLVPNPDEYFTWDFVHWTHTVHEIIGAAAAALVQHQQSPVMHATIRRR